MDLASDQCQGMVIYLWFVETVHELKPWWLQVGFVSVYATVIVVSYLYMYV